MAGDAVKAAAEAPPAPILLDLVGRAPINRIAVLAAALSAVLVFANALANGFVLDDRGVILGNPLVTAPASAWRAFTQPYWPEAIGGGQYRPLGILSFALDWSISGGDPRWFHAVNVMWHAAATVLVWVLAAELLAPVGAAIAALVFAVHPVHVEAVSNVVGRLEPMAAVFALAALLAHRRGSGVAPLWFALGLLSKESAVVLIGLVAANDLVLEKDWRTTVRARRWLYAGYGGVVLAYAALLAVVFREQAIANPARAFTGATTVERLGIVASVIPHYVRLLIAPADLSASYAPNVISPAPGISVERAVGIALLVGGIAGVGMVAARRRWPVMAFALLWVPIALAPVSNVLFESGVVLAERTLYLASVGACLALGMALARMGEIRSIVVAGVAATIIVAFAARTWTRTPAWRDDRTYVLTLLEAHPESYEAHLTAGRVLAGANALNEADRELAIARRIFPRDALIFREAAGVAERQGQPARAAALRDSARIAHRLPLPR
jgi:protein O-mannosyl-transferase